MRMLRLMLWSLALFLPIISAGVVAYLVKDSLLSIDLSQLKPDTIINLGALAVGFAGAFVAIASFFVATFQLQQAMRDSVEQKASLDSSRAQLQGVVDAAIKQQQLLQSNLATSQAQLGLLEEQWNREKERQSRKPKIELLFDNRTETQLRGGDPIVIPLNPRRRAILKFVAINNGNSAGTNPLVSFQADHPNIRIGAPKTLSLRDMDAYRYKLDGVTLHQHQSVDYTLEIEIPVDLELFAIKYQILGDNFSPATMSVRFKAIHPNK